MKGYSVQRKAGWDTHGLPVELGVENALGITKEEAVKALQEFKRFGNDAVLIAKKFGGDFGRFDALAQANTVESALSAIRKMGLRIFNQSMFLKKQSMLFAMGLKRLEF